MLLKSLVHQNSIFGTSYLRYLIALACFLGLGWYIYHGWADLSFSALTIQLWPLLFAIMLLPINYVLEAMKWKHVNAHLNFHQAYCAVLSGQATSVLFPMRMGAFVGRKLQTPQSEWISASLSSAKLAIMQHMVIFCFGLMSLSVIPSTIIPHWTWLALALVGCTIVLFGYFFKPIWLTHSQQSFSWLILFLSISRYLVFTGQLWLLFKAFHLNVNLTAIFAYWVFISLIPIQLFGGVLVRESVGITWFAIHLFMPVNAVIAALFTLWLMNVVLPALTGYYFLIRRLKQWH